MSSEKAAAFTPDLFEADSRTPVGFAYQANLIPGEQERDLLTAFANLPFKPFEFHGFEGKRNVISYGWEYNFSERKLRKADSIPQFLLFVREAAAKFAALAPSDLQHVLLLEYPSGSAIGWHKDKPLFGDVVGISLLSSCTLRFRRRVGKGWERASIVADPRSAYLLRGPSRTEWEHSIPPVKHRRYSVTFRTLASEQS